MNGLHQLKEVERIRKLPVDNDYQSKKIIIEAMNDYDIYPFVPLQYKLRYHGERVKRQAGNNSKGLDLINFWEKNAKKLSKEFFFGKPKTLFRKAKPPLFTGDLQMKALDMKAEMIAKTLLTNYEDNDFHFLLIDILLVRPLTMSEYVSLLIRYPETEHFIKASLGMTMEEEFNKIFQECTNTNIELELAPYLAKVYV